MQYKGFALSLNLFYDNYRGLVRPKYSERKKEMDKKYKKLLTVIDERGISRYRLAKMANITPQDLYAVLGGKRTLFPSWRMRICKALEMSEEELFLSEGGNDENED